MENILIIDACYSPVRLCLYQKDEKKNMHKLKSVFVTENNAINEKLFVSLTDLLNEASIDKNEITNLVAIVGPGSFTGIRIAIAFIKGLQFGLKVDTIGISSFDKYPDDGAVVLNCDNETVYLKVGNKVYEKPVDNEKVSNIIKNEKKIYKNEYSDDDFLMKKIDKCFESPEKYPLNPIYIKGHYAEK